MWSLGEIIFQMLVKQPAFPQIPQLMQYVQGLQPFPSAVLVKHGVSSSAQRFISSTMIPLPEDRLTAAQAWSHNWIMQCKSKRSNDGSGPSAGYDTPPKRYVLNDKGRGSLAKLTNDSLAKHHRIQKQRENVHHAHSPQPSHSAEVGVEVEARTTSSSPVQTRRKVYLMPPLNNFSRKMANSASNVQGEQRVPDNMNFIQKFVGHEFYVMVQLSRRTVCYWRLFLMIIYFGFGKSTQKNQGDRSTVSNMWVQA